jgi:hypothetical protein
MAGGDGSAIAEDFSADWQPGSSCCYAHAEAQKSVIR